MHFTCTLYFMYSLSLFLSPSFPPLSLPSLSPLPLSFHRSLCTLTCKWTYIAHDVEGTTATNNDTAANSDATNVRLSKGWNDSFWCSIGLECLVNEGYKRIGKRCI